MKNKKNYLPIIILVKPQLEENIGAVARAMLNFNLFDLRIVKNKWKPSKVSLQMSAKADEILKKAKIFKNLEEAILDLNYVYATTNRVRDLNTKVTDLKKGIKKINSKKNYKIGIVFGPERSGLNNKDISICDGIIQIPTNKKFNSLNLSQSVLLIAYEIFNSNYKNTTFLETKKAKKEELFIFFKVLENYLENRNFFNIREKKNKMFRNIKTIFNKADLTNKEIKIILGMFKNLTK